MKKISISKWGSIVGLLILMTIFACERNPDGAKMAMEQADMAEMAEEEVNSKPIVERKLIKEGFVEFESQSIGDSRKKILAAVEKHKAYVSSDEEYKSSGRVSNTLVIRMPAEKFDAFLADATQGVDKFERKEIRVKDVTEEFLDIQARLKTKKELEQRYLELLKQAKTVSEILEIETQAGQLRTEIESIEGRLKYLQNKVSFSTLTIDFYQSIPNENQFGQKFKNGLSNGWDNLIWFFVVLTNIWPFVLIGIGIIFAVRRIRKRRKGA